MTATSTGELGKGTNWWGAFVLGLAGTILVTGIVPYAAQGLGAASIPLLALLTGAGVVLCLLLAELAAMMPHRTGGLPSYAYETFSPLGRNVGRHVGGFSAWAYWLGWFPVAPINMILASAYVASLFHLPGGKTLQPFGSIGAPIGVTVLVISIIGTLVMFVPCYFGIRLGAGFATVLGVLSMLPLTAFIVIPLVTPGAMHWSNLAGFHLPQGTKASLPLFAAWAFVMTWSVLAMEAAACYLGECADPHRDAKISMSVEGGYGFGVYVLTAVVILGVVGVPANIDPLTIYTKVMQVVFGEGSFVTWLIGIPLIVALLLSVLNAIAGSARGLYQVAHDGLLPRWFMRVNRHGVPARAMSFNLVAAIVVLFFGSPVRIYVFSNMGYLASIVLALIGYFIYRQYRPELVRPVRMPGFARWVALGAALVLGFVWLYGGWHSPALVVGEKSSELFFLGIAILLAYLPLYGWRVLTDRRTRPVTTVAWSGTAEAPAEAALPAAIAPETAS
jgi:amino acid transporter